ncbi:hypothetical protein PFAG_05963 [Plasmodium falciparum Santa Lucia]|uniref:Uncharacterized protein n=9 Tax=Plasmodium falciparum TaxID=5833 RepID=C0H5F6_PLAF7|nr:conserved protein, unknown function [Plasmodium falciparum 3D7]ETW16843.1 hypothetical protein PFFVO_04234 [Plasmodium falciparum Vietnam Oak-Knoll (FVO)]ETW34668.1 hypothetical protein PFTANZ_04573 [Plasmodium falciparum Tanzania (2000708)]ETW40493.1 hypothetical protein PFNF135_04797 [Plasmodium falciparum NF135/5.C10]ETW47463.1 hypothetical protein PFMALIP_04476 [Plasmodium falciparum MaliPS096_E11]ETW59407.1 hypothetical protein PFMC_04594 [Plasmodium falciparum CAMP/Malaysia]EUR65922.|eukprot:XP_002809053.1 conserved Plasmodium protein, unknown function [Plasmodium falciparum 3D7]
MMMFRPHNVIKNIINSDKKVFLSTINPLNKENKNVIDIYDNYEVLKNMKEKNTLKSSLKKFREIVKKETKRKGYNFYSGWPPVNRIKVTDDEKLGLFGRKMFIYNRIKGIRETETNLFICCKNKNIICFNKNEFISLLKNMEVIKHQLEEFRKKL